MNLLDQLIKDEKKINRKLYSSGPYWSYKNFKSIIEIKKKGISNFRGINSGAGTSFTDSLPCDIRNELGNKGRLIKGFFSLPIVRKIFNLQLSQTTGYLYSYLNILSLIYSDNEKVKKLLQKYKFQNTTEFDCVKKFTYKKKEYSIHYLEMANRIENLSAKFNFLNSKSFFEIGGGFGANVHFMITNFPNIKKIIYLDIVPNIFVGTKYLKKHFGESVVDYFDTRSLTEIKFKDNDDLEIICIPPWEIEKLNLKIDHFHNASSFVEMPKEVIKNYCKFIKKFQVKEISLVSYDNHDEQTTFNPKSLNNFFDNELNVITHDSLIKEFKKKEIYLHSN